MITFEFNEPPHVITNDQLFAIHELINEFGWALNYAVVQHEYDWDGDKGDVICLWVHHIGGQNPTRHHIAIDGTVFLHEDVTWNWKGTEA